MEGVKENIKVKEIDTIEKISGESLDIVKENISKIKELFPEVFCEEKIDFGRLEEVLGNYIEDKEERYRFEWHGKSKAIRLAQTPSRGTLRPCVEESKNWDTTKNLYIEGDNLEVLKLLQKSYQNKVKMIYIDPPYNTGNDFVYKDDYKDNLKNYFEVTGQVDEEGNKVSTNSEGGGRYHTNWLNMMYPRLRLARNLLKDDGVIFISIDDDEQINMKKICDEIFGESNFVTQFLWTKTSTPPSLSYKCRKTVEYVLCYERKSNNSKYFGTFLDNGDAPLLNTGNPVKTINFPKGSIKITYLENGTIKAGQYEKVALLNDIIVKNNVNLNDICISGEFKWGQDTVIDEISNGTYFLIKSNKLSIRFQRIDVGNYKTPNNFLDCELNKKNNVLTNEQAVSELKEFALDKYFDYPKPVSLLYKIMNMITFTDKEAIILDFFSGSSTTAQAAIQLNMEDDGKRRFIMVQLPESTKGNEEAYKAGYKNICEIGKERIRRSGDKIVEENKDKEGIEDLDIGFKVFKLDSSNIKPWNPDYDNIEISLEDTIDNFVPGRTEEDVIYEIMLKYGVDLTYPIETREFTGKKVFSIGFGALIICLDNEITLDIVQSMVDLKNELNPEITRFVFKDNGFKTDSVKTNTIEILKRNNIKDIMSI